MSNSDVEAALARLQIYRRRMALLLQQYAMFDKRHLPSHLTLEIEDVAGQIAMIKDTLRTYGVTIEDVADDSGVSYFSSVSIISKDAYVAKVANRLRLEKFSIKENVPFDSTNFRIVAHKGRYILSTIETWFIIAEMDTISAAA